MIYYSRHAYIEVKTDNIILKIKPYCMQVCVEMTKQFCKKWNPLSKIFTILCPFSTDISAPIIIKTNNSY